MTSRAAISGVLMGFCMSLLAQPESTVKRAANLGQETQEAYAASPYTALSKDYFARFSRDPAASAAKNETAISDDWRIIAPTEAADLAGTMAADLAAFLTRMDLNLVVDRVNKETPPADKSIALYDSGGGDADIPESFTIAVEPAHVVIRGRDPQGLRDGIVKLVETIGLRQAPFLEHGERVYSPRLPVRLGVVPFMGSQRDLVFMGYNAVFAGGGELYAYSKSDVLPELMDRRSPGAADSLGSAVIEARKYGLKTFSLIGLRQKFPEDHPLFKTHPEVRGARTWTEDGEFVMCTEHPLVRQFLTESMRDMFRAAPELDGVALIIGGESFYHCFMRPFGVKKGHTTCPRCEELGAETVVSNLINSLAAAAREVNPGAEVIAWPYSAEHVWSADRAQAGFIAKLKPGAGIFSEMEKSEVIPKPEGFTKDLWDYSIDLIGPGERAKAQIAACKAAGVPIYMKSEPELGFEAPRLPHIPCTDRWLDRADAMAACGASGAWVFPAFRPCYGTSAAESYKLIWWNPVPDREDILQRFAARIAGPEAGPRLRKAWKLVSDAIPLMPELPSYYTGPYYLGPAHPMCVDPKAELPEVFFGQYLFLAEMSDKHGTPLRPTFVTSPTGNVPIFAGLYRRMEALLKDAVSEIDSAAPAVPDRCRLTFDAEASPIRWFHATARSEANFYESCQIRDRLLTWADRPNPKPEDNVEGNRLMARWREVLLDEKANAEAALPLVEGDVRLDFYYGGDHTFPHAADMIRAKLQILDNEINTVLPSIAARCGLASAG